MQKKYKQKIICPLIVLSLLIISCGGPGRAKDDTAEPAPISKKTLSEKHRAFSYYMRGVLYSINNDIQKAADEYRLALFYDNNSDEIRRALADADFQLQQFSEAIETAMDIHDKTVDDILLIADCYSVSGEDSLAIVYYSEASEMDPSIDFPNDYLSAYYFETGDYDKAEKYYRKLVENSANADAWKLELATFFIRTEQWQKAIDVYDEMLKADSLDNRGYVGLAAISEMQHDTLTADSLYSLLYDLNPDNPSILNMISQSFLRLDKLDKAIDVTRRIVEIRPNDYLMKRRYALLQFNFGDLDIADSILTGLTESDDTSEAAIEDPIAFYYRGRIAQQHDDFAKAAVMFEHTIQLEDTLVEAWANLALAYAELDSVDKAMEVLDRAIAVNPADLDEFTYFKGMIYSRLNQFGKAIPNYVKVLEHQPDHLNSLFNLAAAYERSGNFAKAAEYFKRFLTIQPDNAVALNYLGYMYADLGINLDEAEQMIEEALEAAPENSAYLDSYAWVMYKKGEYETALKYQKRAIENDSDDPLMLEHMGDIYNSLENKQQARYHWEKALELDPENESVKEKLNRR